MDEIQKKEGEPIIQETAAPAPVEQAENTPMRTLSNTDIQEVTDETLSVFGLIRQGLTKMEVRAAFKTWKAKKVNAVWNSAIKLMKQNLRDTEEMKADLITKYYDLYFQAGKNGNIKEQRNILDSLSRVVRTIYAPRFPPRQPRIAQGWPHHNLQKLRRPQSAHRRPRVV